MSFTIQTLNQWGGQYLNFAWPMLWQSSVLIAALFVMDFLIRRRIRASIRYALWLVVLVKLCLPPTLALPTSPAWWFHKTPPPPVAQLHYTVTYGTQPLPEIPRNPPPVPHVAPKPVMTGAAWLLTASGFVSVLLMAWLSARWLHVARQVRRSKNSERLTAILNEMLHLAGVKSPVPVRLTGNSMSPAVCGLFHPVILIPQSLAEGFSDEQLRVVLLHEMVHLRRRDVWLNFLQALLQVFYWWHPLVWLANARIRRAREEAVDDAVMQALRDEAESYAPTLLEVAKLALNRPLASLGLVGILESRSALRQRIERLVNFQAPHKAGLTLISLLGIMTFGAVAVPMGGAPGVNDSLNEADSTIFAPANPANRSNAVQSPVARTFRIYHPIGESRLKSLLSGAGVDSPPTVFFYRPNGILFARGSVQQLELVRQVVLKLNGFPPNEIEANNKQFTKQSDAMVSGEPAATNLVTRTFKVDAHVFTDVLRNISGLQTNSVEAMARSLFSILGGGLGIAQRQVNFLQ